MSVVGRWLRSLNPIGVPGSGPWAIFQKEVRASGRRNATYWARGLYAAAFCGFVGLVLLIFVNENSSRDPASRLQQMQAVAPILAGTVMWFQFFGLLFAAPLLVGPSLCDERRNKTLPALLTTPLTVGQIVSGKLLAHLTHLLVFALVPLPVLLGMRVFGGLDPQVVVAGTLVTLGAAVLAASWAMAASLHAPRGVSAAMSAWAMLIVVHGVIPLILGSAGAWLFGKLRIHIPPWIPAALCPPWAMGLVSRELTGSAQAGSLWTVVGTSLSGSLGVSSLLWLWTAGLLRRVMTQSGGEFQPRARAWFTRTPKSPAVPAEGAILPNTPGRVEVAQHHSRTVSDQPVLWRELRLTAFRSRTKGILRMGALLLVLAVIYSFAGLSDPETHQVIAVIAVILFAFASAVITTSSIGTEREARTWPTLLSTPLTSRQIVWGKFVGGFCRLWPIPSLAAIVLLILAPLGDIFVAPPLFYYFTSFVVIAAFLCAAGVLWSLVIRRTSLAGIFALLSALTLWLVIPLMVEFLAALAGYRQSGDFASYLLSASPVSLAVSSAVEIRHRHAWDWNITYAIAGLRYAPKEFAILCAAVWSMYGLATFVILRVAANVLRRGRGNLA